MIYQTGDMVLSSIRVIMRGEVNDIEICQDLSAPAKPSYILVLIKERELAKKILFILGGEDEGSFVRRVFSIDTNLCFLFDYQTERPLRDFGDSQMLSPRDREQVCANIILECLSAQLPYPLLYLVLDTQNINIQKDNAVFFTPYFDFALLDADAGESDCVLRCLDVVLDTLRGSSKKPLKSFELLSRKKLSGSYQSFPELYKDLKTAALPTKKKKLRYRIAEFFASIKDPLFRVLLIICLAIFLFALIVLISQLLFGDVPLFRLFSDSFRVIGTERLGK